VNKRKEAKTKKKIKRMSHKEDRRDVKRLINTLREVVR